MYKFKLTKVYKRMTETDKNFMERPLVEKKYLTNNSGDEVIDDCGRKTVIGGEPILDFGEYSNVMTLCPKIYELVLQIRNRTSEFHGKKIINGILSCDNYFYDRSGDDEGHCLDMYAWDNNHGKCPFGANNVRFKETFATESAMKALHVIISISNPNQTRCNSSNPKECGLYFSREGFKSLFELS